VIELLPEQRNGFEQQFLKSKKIQQPTNTTTEKMCNSTQYNATTSFHVVASLISTFDSFQELTNKCKWEVVDRELQDRELLQMLCHNHNVR
jgi:hypothetical protein